MLSCQISGRVHQLVLVGRAALPEPHHDWTGSALARRHWIVPFTSKNRLPVKLCTLSVRAIEHPSNQFGPRGALPEVPHYGVVGRDGRVGRNGRDGHDQTSRSDAYSTIILSRTCLWWVIQVAAVVLRARQVSFNRPLLKATTAQIAPAGGLDSRRIEQRAARQLWSNVGTAARACEPPVGTSTLRLPMMLRTAHEAESCCRKGPITRVLKSRARPSRAFASAKSHRAS
jgi:hypothetical protein